MVEPGRHTQGCNPRLEVLNLGLGTLICGVDWEELATGVIGLKSGTLLKCRLACAGLGVEFTTGREENVGSWGNGQLGAGGGGGDRGAGFHCGLA